METVPNSFQPIPNSPDFGAARLNALFSGRAKVRISKGIIAMGGGDLTIRNQL